MKKYRTISDETGESSGYKAGSTANKIMCDILSEKSDKEKFIKLIKNRKKLK